MGSDPVRVFLDANVLFSAAWRADSGLRRLWNLRGVELTTSVYALAEARANLEGSDRVQRLEELTAAMPLVAEHTDAMEPIEGTDLPEKDRPIMRAAIQAEADLLLTGDRRHFGSLFGRTVQGVAIRMPADFLRSRPGNKI